MSSSHVAYDTQSGRIVGVHHGHIDAGKAHQLVEHYARFMSYARSRQHAKVSEEQFAVITVPFESFKSGKQYKVDVTRKVLVEVAAGEGGLGLGFTPIRRS